MLTINSACYRLNLKQICVVCFQRLFICFAGIYDDSRARTFHRVNPLAMSALYFTGNDVNTGPSHIIFTDDILPCTPKISTGSSSVANISRRFD